MNTYQKISNVFARDPNTHKLIDGEFKKPEFNTLKDAKWVATEKVDGTNIRIIITDKGVKFAGKTNKAQIPAPLLEHLIHNYTDLGFISITDMGFCLYGEGYGGKIQKAGSSYGQEQRFIMFDVKVFALDEESNYSYWMPRTDMLKFASDYNIPAVPALSEIKTLRQGIEAARFGFTSYWGDFLAEGLIMKPETELLNSYGERVIVKLKHKDFVSANDS